MRNSIGETKRVVLATIIATFASAMSACGHSDSTAPAASPISWADKWVDGWTGGGRGPNGYAHESQGGALYTLWADDPNSNNLYSNQSDCSFFGGTTLFKKSYGWSDAGLARWLCQGACPSARPQAFHYHDAILASNHFTPVTNVNSVASGDLIALKYYDTNADTGHLMWVDAAPALHCSSCAPIEWSVPVIDSSSSYHGTGDTRYVGTSCSSDADCSANPYAACNQATLKCAYTGVGRGILRLYADGSGAILGYSWSASSDSTRYLNSDSPLQRHIVVGRYDGTMGQ